MKSRVGFVSNSSTSSFCVYGVHMTLLDAMQKLSKHNPRAFEDLKIQMIEYVSPEDKDSSWYQTRIEDLGYLVTDLADDEPKALAHAIFTHFSDVHQGCGELWWLTEQAGIVKDSDAPDAMNWWSCDQTVTVGVERPGGLTAEDKFKATVEKRIAALFGEAECDWHRGEVDNM